MLSNRLLSLSPSLRNAIIGSDIDGDVVHVRQFQLSMRARGGSVIYSGNEVVHLAYFQLMNMWWWEELNAKIIQKNVDGFFILKALPCENKCEQTKRAKIFIPILSLEVIPRAKINKRNVDEYIILYESLWENRACLMNRWLVLLATRACARPIIDRYYSQHARLINRWLIMHVSDSSSSTYSVYVYRFHS